MRFLPWWRDRRKTDPAGNRLERFRKVLEAARSNPVYQPSLRTAKLDSSKSLRQLKSVEATLAQLGVFNLEQIRSRPPRKIGSPVIFASPLSDGVTPDLFWNSKGCAVLEEKSGSKRGKRALFIRIGLDEGLLSPVERDGLWQRHGVPMFEHMIGMDGKLLAWECETHRGLHIVEENVVFELVEGELLLTSLTDLAQPTLQMRTGWTARVETDPCDCGRPGPRLTGLRERLSRPRTGPNLDGLAIGAAS
jgi:hypothetical protein